MKPIDRLKQYLDYKQIKPGNLDRNIGAGNGYIGKQIKARASVGSDILEKIFQFCPDLNPAWLLTGNGDMIANQQTQEVEGNPIKSSDLNNLPAEEQVKILKLEIELKEIEVSHLRKKMEILNNLKKLKDLNGH